MANHPVVITSTTAQASGSVLEQGGVTGGVTADLTTGVITFTDADVADVHTVVSVAAQGSGYLGSLTLGTLADSTGGVTGSVAWTFSVPDHALDFLAAGQTLVQSYVVTLGDGHGLASRATQTVTVTITGTNDVPVIGGVNTGTVTEDVAVVAGTLADSGRRALSDVGQTQCGRVAHAETGGRGGLGALSLEAAGLGSDAAHDAQAGIRRLPRGQWATNRLTAT